MKGNGGRRRGETNHHPSVYIHACISKPKETRTMSLTAIHHFYYISLFKTNDDVSSARKETREKTTMMTTIEEDPKGEKRTTTRQPDGIGTRREKAKRGCYLGFRGTIRYIFSSSYFSSLNSSLVLPASFSFLFFFLKPPIPLSFFLLLSSILSF